MQNLTDYISIDECSIKNFIFDMLNCIIYLLSAISSSILNCILILSWLLHCKKNSYSDLIFISNAVSDFLNGFIVCNSHFITKVKEADFNENVKFSQIFNYIVSVIDDTMFFTSLTSLLLLAYHRYRQLVIPFKEKDTLNRFRIFSIISSWFISLIIASIRNYFGLFSYKNFIELSFCVIFYCIPISLITILNILIIRTFKIKLKNKKIQKNKIKNEKKAIACTLFISLAVLVTFGFWLLFYPFELFEFKFVQWFHSLYLSFAYFYSSLNPLVVLYFNKKMRSFLLNKIKVPKNNNNKRTCI